MTNCHWFFVYVFQPYHYCNVSVLRVCIVKWPEWNVYLKWVKFLALEMQIRQSFRSIQILNVKIWLSASSIFQLKKEENDKIDGWLQLLLAFFSLRWHSSKHHFCWFQWLFLVFCLFIIIDEYEASLIGPIHWSSVIPQALLLLLYVINELITFSACFDTTPIAGRIADPVVNFTFTKFQSTWIPTDTHFQHTCAGCPQTGNIIAPHRFRLWCWKWINGRFQSWHRWTY